jgi:hypothetical protein
MTRKIEWREATVEVESSQGTGTRAGTVVVTVGQPVRVSGTPNKATVGKRVFKYLLKRASGDTVVQPHIRKR